MILAFRRIAQTVIALLVLITATFLLLHILPGGPFDSENALPPEVKAALEARYHLNEPLITQYLIYLKSLGRGDLGSSYAYLGQNVSEIFKDTLPVTLKLGGMSLVVCIALGIPLGLVAAAFYNSWIDALITVITATGLCLPVFVLAPVLILVFSFWLDWLPPALWEGPSYYVLPVFVLAVRPASLLARLVRASALDNITSDFVRTARAKGAGERRILFKHVFKNSLIPVFGIGGPLITNILSGSFVVEMMFAVPGLGTHMVQSVDNRDYPLIMALTIFYALLLSAANLLMDLLSMAVDPRVRIT